MGSDAPTTQLSLTGTAKARETTRVLAIALPKLGLAGVKHPQLLHQRPETLYAHACSRPCCSPSPSGCSPWCLRILPCCRRRSRPSGRTASQPAPMLNLVEATVIPAVLKLPLLLSMQPDTIAANLLRNVASSVSRRALARATLRAPSLLVPRLTAASLWGGVASFQKFAGVMVPTAQPAPVPEVGSYQPQPNLVAPL